MRHLLILLVGLLLASGVWAQPSGKGMIANCTNADIISGTCAGLGTGTRVYDTTNSVELTYDGTSWVNSGGTGTFTDITATGVITGRTDVVVSVADDTPAAAELRGTMHIADHTVAATDVIYTLPDVSTIGVGASACFYDNGGGGGGIRIDPPAGDIILLDGTSAGDGVAIDSPGVDGAGANGDYICILAIDADTTWITTGRSGLWEVTD